ncbi:hypothetical protein E2P81_ATG06551 [Venturia nashicola]|nr:hypothetical protein E2P81_ATG06551 [Venturia nashicola]
MAVKSVAVSYPSRVESIRRTPNKLLLQKRNDIQCTPRPRKRSRKARAVKDELMDERLRLYEAALREQGIDPENIAGTSRVETHLQRGRLGSSENARQSPADTELLGVQSTVFTPQLIHGEGGTKFVDNNLWSRLAEEFHDTAESDFDDESSDDVACGDDFIYVLEFKSSKRRPPHPSADHIHQLWHAFLSNVNPLTKLVHVPTLEPAIEKAIAHNESIPKGFEALMFSIYSIATLSLTDAECIGKLGECKATLLPRFVGATRNALSRAGFMGSTSIVTLQALIFHIFSIRDVFEPRAIWALTGLAIRIAENMGMRIDGTILGLSPFETEIRRRVWWQLHMHNFRAAELSGQAKFRNFDLDETTPRKPTNVNDNDLSPTMQKAAVDSVRPTEMIYCMLRSDLASFAAAQKAKMNKMAKPAVTSEDFSAMDDLKVKDMFIKELEDLIETKYLRFCDPSQPLQFLTLLGARLSTNLIRFIAHHPRRWANLEHVPHSEQQLIWGIAMGLLEQYDMMQSSPQLRRFAWCVPYFIQWHAVIHVLDTLRASPFHPDASNAWRLIDALYINNPQMSTSIKRPIFEAVGNLCLKAYEARAVALEARGQNAPQQPEYIKNLQEAREGTNAKREAAIAKRKERTHFGAERSVVAANTNVAQTRNDPASSASAETVPQAYTTHTEDDAFWLNNALHNFGEGGNGMDLDLDAVLAQDYWLDNPNEEGIDWAQWDALVTNMGPGRNSFAGT